MEVVTTDKFIDIVNLTKTRCNLDGVDTYDNLIKAAINEAYLELKKEDPTVSTTFAPNINGMITLPDDLNSILTISPELDPVYRKIGKYIITDQDETFEIKYTTVVDLLTNDTDEPDINKKYWYIMSTYGCYAYYSSKKKLQEANNFLNEYLTAVKKLQTPDELPYTIQNVYGNFF